MNREIVVSGASSALANQVTIGPHGFTADEPADKGGGDAGPSPFELVCAALGACTSITLAMYARSRKIPLEHVTVRLVHTRQEGTPRRNRIDRVIELRGALSEDERAKLLEIAEKCPVHRAYGEGIDIATKLA